MVGIGFSAGDCRAARHTTIAVNEIAALPYNPDDVPALALSFEWYSKAWWPRARVEEFARTYGKMTTAETARMIDRCMEAVAAGSRLVEQMAAQIKGFGDMESKLAALWWKRMMAFGA